MTECISIDLTYALCGAPLSHQFYWHKDIGEVYRVEYAGPKDSWFMRRVEIQIEACERCSKLLILAQLANVEL